MTEEHTKQDSYSLFVPIEDSDLLKSVEMDENGDYIVQGVMSSDAKDEEDDTITPEGMDCTYFLEKGWVKYEHGKNPDQFIGEPLEVRVGRFEHPTLKKAVNGIFVRAKLFANRTLTKQAITAMEDLQKADTKRRMGWSIEGNVVKRHPKTGKIVKSVLRNVVLTMNPVNTTTWAELAKSFAKDHELTVDMDEPNGIDFVKAMDVSSMAPVAKQSLEKASEDGKDPQQKWIDTFRKMVREALLRKSVAELVYSGADGTSIHAFDVALRNNYDFEEAEIFSSYAEGKHDILKALVTNFNSGGVDGMSEKSKNLLSTLLDEDLEELKKSLELDKPSEDDELEKAIDSEDEDDNEGAEDDNEGTEDEEGDDELEKGIEDDEDDEDDEEGGEVEEDDEDVEKSFRTDLTKSMAENGQKQAFEVSEFLQALTDEIGFSIGGVEKSLMGVTKQNNAIVKSLVGLTEATKKLLVDNEELRAENEEIKKSFEELLNRPVGRKSVVSMREAQTISKSIDPVTPVGSLTREQVTDALLKSFDAGELEGSVIQRFEAGVPLRELNLPDKLQKSLGLGY